MPFSIGNKSIKWETTNNINAGTLTVANGGTGVTTIGAGNIVIGGGAAAVTSLASGANGNVIYGTGVATWASGTPDTAGLVDKTSIHRKYPAKINGNRSFGKFRSNLVNLFYCTNPQIILENLHRYFIRDPLPIRKNRTFQRIIKNKHQKNKHKTFMNYKPSF